MVWLSTKDEIWLKNKAREMESSIETWAATVRTIPDMLDMKTIPDMLDTKNPDAPIVRFFTESDGLVSRIPTFFLLIIRHSPGLAQRWLSPLRQMLYKDMPQTDEEWSLRTENLVSEMNDFLKKQCKDFSIRLTSSTSRHIALFFNICDVVCRGPIPGRL